MMSSPSDAVDSCLNELIEQRSSIFFIIFNQLQIIVINKKKL